MKKSDLDKFFQAVGEKIQWPVEIYLTGGVLAWFFGGVRPTQDLDFALNVEKKWNETASVLSQISRAQSLPVEFSEDISRWGMIGYPDFKKGAKLYKKFGSVKVLFLDPVIWSVGKMARYTSDDVADMVAVFKKQQPSKAKVKRVWQEALQQSPRSSESHLFQKKIDDFFMHY